MSLRTITTVAFSPCGGTVQRLRRIASLLQQSLGLPCRHLSYTLPADRVPLPPFGNDELVVWGSPVYAGRLPNKLTAYVTDNLRGHDTPFIGVVTFGNRSAGDALAELVGIARRNGCRPLGAAALAMPHVFSATLAYDRPTANDEAELERFALQMARKAALDSPALPPFGNESPTAFYTPLKTDGTPALFLKAKPQVDASRCTRCGLCLGQCPMGSLVPDGGLPHADGICIKCQACIHACPQGALGLAHPDFLSHTAMLEQHYSAPAPNLFFV